MNQTLSQRTRFTAYEVSPVLEQDIDGMGGIICMAYSTLLAAKDALDTARADEIEARIVWTIYGRTDGDGAEAITDLPSEDLAFDLLYKLTGIAGVSGTCHYVVESTPTSLLATRQLSRTRKSK